MSKTEQTQQNTPKNKVHTSVNIKLLQKRRILKTHPQEKNKNN